MTILKDKAVREAVDLIVAALLKDKEVKVTGLGIFRVKNRPARKGFNPATKLVVQLPASKRIAFKASKSLSSQL
jgi:DNA-binding protein HU-beta